MLERLSKEELIEKVKELEAKKEVRIAEIEKQLAEAIDEASRRGKELSVLMKSSQAILTHKGFTDAARSIFDYCKDLIGAASGYVALLNEDGSENEVLFLEAGGLPCDVDPGLPMPIRGLRSIAYSKRQAVYENDFMNCEWVEFMPEGHVVLKNVIFAPLIIDNKAVGIIGLANKETDFDDNDAKIAAGFGELAAIALRNSRNLDARDKAEQEKERVIGELKDALAQVKKLSGLLPICSSCKKVRDDKGYWKQIESYIRDHSEADFSHSICPDCVKKLYPDLNTG